MAGEYVSGVPFKEKDNVEGYQIKTAFDPGGFAFAGKAVSPSGQPVFFKKYKSPGAASAWYEGFVAYQNALKDRIQADPGANSFCYKFLHFFQVKKEGGMVPLRAFYQVFEWVEGGKDLRGVLTELNENPSAYDWNQRVIFGRVMMAAINAIHKAGIIHTDLKPENLYLLPDPTIAAKYKLRIIDMDFSIIEGRQAPWADPKLPASQKMGYVGTPGYMSPEHIRNQVPQKASDVFTCALILGELMGGGHPAAALMEDYEERANAGGLQPIAVQKPIAEVRDLDYLNYVINAALRPEPGKRPTAEQLLKALNNQLPEFDGRRPKTATPPPPTPRPSPPPPPPPPVQRTTALEIVGAGGQKVQVNIGAKFGRMQFKAWSPDFEKFMATEQFRLFKDAGGRWMIEPCAGATNATTANGTPLTGAVPVTTGMVLALGKTGKCPITLKLT